MALHVAGQHVTYTFTDPSLSIESLEDKAGIFLILARDTEVYRLLDIGEAAQVRTGLAEHTSHGRWLRQYHGRLAYSAAYMAGLSALVRQAIVADIRSANDLITPE